MEKIVMTEKRTVARQAFGDIAPALAELTDDVLFTNVWERPGLSPRDRSLITITTSLGKGYSKNLAAG
jgi:4-carboxymuconolactone decarboxylase